MGCGGTKIKLDPATLKEKHREMFEKLNYNEIQVSEINNYTEKKLIYFQKHNGYRLLIEDTINHLNIAMEGSFVDQKYKNDVIVKFVYLFMNVHQNKAVYEAKKELIKEYLLKNKNLILYFWYSVCSIPRVLNYLLVQTLVSPLLPKEDEDLEFFYGGTHNYDGLSSTKSPVYVGKKVKEIFPDSNLHLTEKIIKEYILKPEDDEYIQEMIKLEKQEEEKPKEFRQILEVSKELIFALIERILVFYHPYILFDIYTGNSYSVKQMSDIIKVDLIKLKDDFLKAELEKNLKELEKSNEKEGKNEEKNNQENKKDEIQIEAEVIGNKDKVNIENMETDKVFDEIQNNINNSKNDKNKGNYMDLFNYDKKEREVLGPNDVVDSSSEDDR
jgi:hypothetical protein